MLPAGLLKRALFGIALLTTTAGAAQSLVPLRVPAAPPAAPKLLVKAGLRLTHLFYLPDNQSWQLVLPSSLGLEYRLKPTLSLYAQLEADISASRKPRGRRSTVALPTPTTDFSLGARYYFDQPNPGRWGNYVALETAFEFTQLGLRGRGRRSQPTARVTPGVFAFCGTQNRGPGRLLLYDLNAGLGIQAPPPYAAESVVKRPWDVAGQVNLRVYFVNQSRASKAFH